ncbi:MAG TPA: biotin/lipoate A/B protein ligase family protein [Candidatus Krumholzibacteriaceae bacterium]|nr:biotin/lipoate A/B protein ligase family protein [Candidatus Krumholzibacteriaceae bacterium]
MTRWRLLKLETYDAATNMAIDETILRSRIRGKAPNTIRFYRWTPSAVSIGKFQNVHNEVNLENCEKYGVDVVRRITGGGAVYHDSQDEITYSVVVGREDLRTEDVTAAYNKICNGLTNTLDLLGVKADFNPGDPKNCPNITVNGRKISGSAQSFKSGVVLQHGTLLLSVNLEKMFTYLRVPWAKTCMEIVNVAERKITSLKKELEAEIGIEQAYAALVKGFQNALEMDLSESVLTPEEKETTAKLRTEKFANKNWTFLGAWTNKV